MCCPRIEALLAAFTTCETSADPSYPLLQVYNSRVSSVVPTGTDIRRPKNIYWSDGIDSEPAFGPSRLLDYELEMGYFVSKPVGYGERMPIGDAKEHIFGESCVMALSVNVDMWRAEGCCGKDVSTALTAIAGFVLLNDWSARDQ